MTYFLGVKMRKAGRKIKTMCCMPNGIRIDTAWELPIRAALLSIANGNITQGHYDDFRTLAIMSKRTTKEAHIIRHADSLTHVLKPVAERGGDVTGNEAASVRASVFVLLDHIAGVHNGAIGRAAKEGIRAGV